MKTFMALMDETQHINDLDELESAADLFQFGIEKGYYTKKQADEFNNIYWKVKNKLLAYKIADKFKISTLDIVSIISDAPNNLKNDMNDITSYVNGRIKALKGKMSGLR